jgi:transcription antitermination factor NusG
MVELRSEKTIEGTMKRVGKALHGIFRNDPIEIFIPVVKRDLDVFEMSTGPYVFVRSTSFSSLLRLKQITGVVSLVTEGDTNRPSKAIPIEDTYVQGLIKQAEEEHRKRAIGIEVGSFVRVLNGETRDYCGTVEIIGDGKAVVRITLKPNLSCWKLRSAISLTSVPPPKNSACISMARW